MIFAAKEQGELFRVRTPEGFHSVVIDDIKPTSVTLKDKEADLKLAADKAFPVAEEGWHFYVHIFDAAHYSIWGGGKHLEPGKDWWENDPFILEEKLVG